MLRAAHEMKCVAMGPFWVLSLREDSQKDDQDDGLKFLGRRAIGSWVVAHGGLWWWAIVVGDGGGLWWTLVGCDSGLWWALDRY